jgi:uncharacterized protein YndB with AHSA1/START domain
MDDPTALRIERTFAAPPERVFAAWTAPEVLHRWFAAGPDWMNTVVEVDLRVGGRYRLTMRGPDTVERSVVGEYLQVDPPHRLSYTWMWEQSDGPAVGVRTVVTIEFRAVGEGTSVVLTQTGFPSADLRDQHGAGWRACMDNLATRGLVAP